MFLALLLLMLPLVTAAQGKIAFASTLWKTDKAWKGTCRMLVVKFIDNTHTSRNSSSNNSSARLAAVNPEATDDRGDCVREF